MLIKLDRIPEVYEVACIVEAIKGLVTSFTLQALQFRGLWITNFFSIHYLHVTFQGERNYCCLALIPLSLLQSLETP